MDRDKESYLQKLLDNEWYYQYTIYISDEQDIDLINVSDLYKKLRLSITRRFKTQPFLFRVQVSQSKRSGEYLPILTMFTTCKIERLKRLVAELSKSCDVTLLMNGRVLADKDINYQASVIRRADPYDINKFLKQAKPNRHSITNKSFLIKRGINDY